MKFQVGDEVKRVRGGSGRDGRVVKVIPNHYDEGDGLVFTNDPFGWSAENYELVVRPQNFKVGDRVRATKTVHSEYELSMQPGDVARVIGVREGRSQLIELDIWPGRKLSALHYGLELVDPLEWDPSQHRAAGDIPCGDGPRVKCLAAWMHFCFLAPTIQWRLNRIKSETVMVEIKRSRVEKWAAVETRSFDWFVDACQAALDAEVDHG